MVYPTPGPVTVAIIVDINSDGIPDIVVLVPGGIGILLGTGHGSFGPVQSSGNSESPTGATVGDVSGDGLPDVVTTSPNGGAVHHNGGNGRLDPPASADLGSPSGISPVLADVNGDGKLDLIVPQTSPSVAVLLGNGDDTFKPPTQLPTQAKATGLHVADLNCDGIPDLIVSTSRNVEVHLGNGDGTFKPTKSYPASGDVTQIADLTGDGQPDVVVSVPKDGLVSILINVGRGVLAPELRYRVGGPSLSALVMADVNGDGRLDAVALSPRGIEVSLATCVCGP